jgi:hypothetical protein
VVRAGKQALHPCATHFGTAVAVQNSKDRL